MHWHKGWHIIDELPLTRDDVEFLRGLLTGGEPEIQKALLWNYWTTWRMAENAEPVVQKKDNAGRRAANEWIRMEVDQLRHQEPETVRKYRKAVQTPPPRCCHTCDHYRDDGVCEKFDMEPPEDFAATEDACPEYEQEVPF